jgi:calcineurin-like phosphoesterase
VQTSDAGVLGAGTGFITDLGMTGAADSILGVKPELSISRMLGNPPEPYQAAEGRAKLEGAVFTIDADSGLCTDVRSLRIMQQG